MTSSYRRAMLTDFRLTKAAIALGTLQTTVQIELLQTAQGRNQAQLTL